MKFKLAKRGIGKPPARKQTDAEGGLRKRVSALEGQVRALTAAVAKLGGAVEPETSKPARAKRKRS